jgi:hypothetical protein
MEKLKAWLEANPWVLVLGAGGVGLLVLWIFLRGGDSGGRTDTGSSALDTSGLLGNLDSSTSTGGDLGAAGGWPSWFSTPPGWWIAGPPAPAGAPPPSISPGGTPGGGAGIILPPPGFTRKPPGGAPPGERDSTGTPPHVAPPKITPRKPPPVRSHAPNRSVHPAPVPRPHVPSTVAQHASVVTDSSMGRVRTSAGVKPHRRTRVGGNRQSLH